MEILSGAVLDRQNSDDPQVRQNAYPASVTGKYHSRFEPLSLMTRSAISVAVAAMWWPVNRLHLWQWQLKTSRSSPSVPKVMAPQRH